MITVERLDPVRSAIEPDGSLTIKATVRNRTSTSLSQPVKCQLNGSIIHSQQVTLDGDAMETISVEVDSPTDIESGWHTIGLFAGDDGQTGSVLLKSGDPFEDVLYRYQWLFVTGEGILDQDHPRVERLVDALDTTVEEYRSSMIETPTDRLWPANPIGEGNEDTDAPWRELQASFGKLIPLAKAYVTPASTYHADQDVLDAIVHGLEFLTEYYSAEQEPYGDGWQWGVGISKRVIRPLVLLGDELPTSLLEHHLEALEEKTGFPEAGGGAADTMSVADVWIKIGLLKRDEALIEEALSAIPSQFEYRGRDSFFRDGSSTYHDNVPYTTHYGARYLDEAAPLARFLQESPWRLSRDDLCGDHEFLFEIAAAAFEPLVWRGQAMSMTAGRMQLNDYESQAGLELIEDFLHLGALDSGDRADRWKSIAKAWIQENTYRDFLQDRSTMGIYGPAAKHDVGTYGMAVEVLEDESIHPREPLVTTKQYANMDRAVYRNADFAVGLAMLSDRTLNFEVIGGPRDSEQGWFASYGMTYLYTDDLAQYNDGYWHTVDPRHLPGTTANPGETDRIESDTPGRGSHAGGVTFDERAASSGMALTSVLGPESLTAQKSWFYFGDVLVSVGSAIAGESETEEAITTTVANRNLGRGGDGTIRVDGTETAAAAPADEEHAGVSCAHLERASESVGYLFPDEPAVRVVREANDSRDPETGTRSPLGGYEIRRTDPPYERTFGKLLLEHGPTPEGASYSYAVVPGANAERTASLAEDPPYEVLVQTDSLHVVRDAERLLVGVQAFEAARAEDPAIAADGPASVMYRSTAESVTVAIADPTLERGEITVTLPETVGEPVATDQPLTVLDRSPLKVRVDTSSLDEHHKGATVRATFER